MRALLLFNYGTSVILHITYAQYLGATGSNSFCMNTWTNFINQPRIRAEIRFGNELVRMRGCRFSVIDGRHTFILANNGLKPAPQRSKHSTLWPTVPRVAACLLPIDQETTTTRVRHSVLLRIY